MDTKNYTLDELEKIFGSHSKQHWEDETRRRKHPDYVPWNKDDFVITDALLSIVRAIKEIKEC